MTGRTLTALGGAAVVALSVAALCRPRQATRGYGIPASDPEALAYVRACAARDLALGGILLWSAIANDVPAMRAGLTFGALIPLADGILVAGRRGLVPQLAVHASGVLGIAAALAAAGRR